MMATAAGLQAQTADAGRLERLEKENTDLRKRLDSLELVAQKEGLVSSAAKGAMPVTAMSKMSLSGFVTASYFHDTSKPNGNVSPAISGTASPTPSRSTRSKSPSPARLSKAPVISGTRPIAPRSSGVRMRRS